MRHPCPLSLALGDAYQRSRTQILRRLRRSFYNAPAEQLEDALSQGLVSLLETAASPDAAAARALRTGGPVALERLLSTAAWRALRGDHRRLRSRRERCQAELPDLADRDHPLALFEARRTLLRVSRLVPVAARRFGPTRTIALQAALLDRLASEDTDGVVAARHDVGRSQLCRARGWLEAELSA